MKEDERNRKKGSEEEREQSLRRAGPIATAQTPTANTTMPPADNKTPTRRPAQQYDLAPWGRAKRSQKIRARSKRKGGWETAARKGPAHGNRRDGQEEAKQEKQEGKDPGNDRAQDPKGDNQAKRREGRRETQDEGRHNKTRSKTARQNIFKNTKSLARMSNNAPKKRPAETARTPATGGSPSKKLTGSSPATRNVNVELMMADKFTTVASRDGGEAVKLIKRLSGDAHPFVTVKCPEEKDREERIVAAIREAIMDVTIDIATDMKYGATNYIVVAHQNGQALAPEHIKEVNIDGVSITYRSGQQYVTDGKGGNGKRIEWATAKAAKGLEGTVHGMSVHINMDEDAEEACCTAIMSAMKHMINETVTATTSRTDISKTIREARTLAKSTDDPAETFIVAYTASTDSVHFATEQHIKKQSFEGGNITIVGGRTFGKTKSKAAFLGFHKTMEIKQSRTEFVTAAAELEREIAESMMGEEAGIAGWAEIYITWGKDHATGGWGGKCWMQEHGDYTLLRAQLCCDSLTAEHPPNEGYERTVEGRIAAAKDRNSQTANGTSATIGTTSETAVYKAVQKLKSSKYSFNVTMLGKTFFRVTAASTNDLLKLNEIIGDASCRIQREKKVDQETMKELNKVQLAKDKSWAEAASRKEEQNAKMKARMQKKAKAAAQKSRGTAEYTALMETAAATYREMKTEELEELAEEEAMEMVDKTA